MAEITATVQELFEMRALILGWQVDGQQVIPGFAREAALTEGTKRRATKIGRILEKEVAAIQKQLEEIGEYKEEGLSEEELEKVKDEKRKELLADPVTIGNIELLDFTKIEDVVLSYPYNLLYEKIFIDSK